MRWHRALASTALLALACGSAPQTEADAPYEAVLYEKDVMVPMRDGIRLATDIYRPAVNGVPVEGPLPAVLTRTPYDKSSSTLRAEASYFARHGYVAVVQDTRGRFNSEGVWSKYYDHDS